MQDLESVAEETVAIQQEGSKEGPAQGQTELHRRSYALLKLMGVFMLGGITTYVVLTCASGPEDGHFDRGGYSHSRSFRLRPDDLVALNHHRSELVSASLSMIMDASRISPREPLIDITTLCSIWEDALATVGLNGLLTSLMETYSFQAEFDKLVESRGVPIKTTLGGIPNDFSIKYDADFISDPGHTFGALWWLRHWMGSFLAQKIMTGPISFHGEMHGHVDGYVNNSVDLIHEVMRSLEEPGSFEQGAESPLHGLVWYLIPSATGHKIEEYPSDIARTWCKSDDVDQDPNRPWDSNMHCLHGIGHGVFYSFALAELGVEVSVCNPLYPPAFRLSNASLAKAFQVCASAPTLMARQQCHDGVHHSASLSQV